MALDPSFVGREYPPSRPYQVCREKIREFADAIGAPDAAYRDPGAAAALGHPDVIAPPTFPIIISMTANQVIIDDPELGLDYTRVVHGDQRFAYQRPVRAGDVLVCASVIEESRVMAGMGFLGTRTDVRTDQGELVVSVWTRLVVRQ